MKRITTAPTPLEWGVIAFGLWHSRDILQAWQHSPRDRGGATIFGVWLLPFLVACFQDRIFSCSTSFLRSRFSIFAIIIILVGTLGDLNALVYGGLALALTAGGFDASKARGLTWLIASVTWMPAFSYVTHSLPSTLILIAKFGIAIIAVFAISINRRPLTSK